MRIFIITAVTVLIAVSAHANQADSLESILLEANTAFGKRHYQKAYDLYQIILANDSSSAKVLLNTGVSAASLGRPDEARALIEMAYRLEPKNPDIVNNLGVMLSNEGDTRGAIKLFNEALQLDTTSAVLKVNLAQEYLKRGLGLKAIPLLQSAIAIEPEEVLPKFLLANAFAGSRKPDSAEYWYLEAAKEQDNDPELYYRLGSVQRNQGKIDAAQASYEKSLALDPSQRDCHQALAMLHLDKLSYGGAEKHFYLAVKADSSYLPAWIGLGVVFQLTEQKDQFNMIANRLNELDSSYTRQILQMTEHYRKQ